MSEFTEAAVERYELLAGNRPFVTGCWLCLFTAMSVTATRKNTFRVECVACATNGFIARADLTWGLIGCGEGVRALPFRKRRALRSLLRRHGEPQLSAANWVTGVYGPEETATRSVLRFGVVCPGCGSNGASLRRDVNDRAYLSCARGCRARLFLPREESAARLVGWTLERAEKGDALWNGWFKRGKTTWDEWHGGTGPKALGANVIDAEVIDVRVTETVRR